MHLLATLHVSIPPAVLRAVSSAILCTVLILLQTACSDPEAEMNQALRDEIIQVHDQAMIQTGLIFDLQTRLEEMEPPTGDLQQRVARLIDELREADRAMFAWMNQYQILAVDDDIGVDNDYREEQLEAIRSVSGQTDQAIGNARTFLDQTAGDS